LADVKNKAFAKPTRHPSAVNPKNNVIHCNFRIPG